MSKLTEDEVVQIAKDCGVLPTNTTAWSKTVIYNLSKELLTFSTAIEAKVRAEHASNEAVVYIPNIKNGLVAIHEDGSLAHSFTKTEVYNTPLFITPASELLLAQNKELVECAVKMRSALENAGREAEAGLCYFTLISAREFLKDIRRTTEEALATPLPAAMKEKE